MIQFFRSFMSSKIGVAVMLAFLALIAFAFASSDVANTSLGTTGISGGDRVAVVGGQRITATELSTAASNAFEQARQTNPTLTMQAFVAQGGLGQALDGLLSRTAVAEFARRHGLRAGTRLVDSELLKIPAFQGADGRFSREAFNAVLQQRQMTEAVVRQDFAANLYAQQLLTPIGLSPVLPVSFAERYAALLKERRRGVVVALPSEAFAPTGDPSAADLQAFYQANRDRFIRPERRVIRYVQFGEEALGTLPAPTAAQIAERYARDRAQYAASESRTFTQLVVPTQAAAQAIAQEVRGGASLSAAAEAKGLRAVTVGPVTQAQLTTSASAAVAQAAFRAAQGALTAPTRGGLGWYVIRIDAIDRRPARTIDQARGEIAAALATEQRATALADLTARIEDEFDGGGSLADVARELKLTLASTAPATADGRLYGQATATLPPQLGPVLRTAFEMEEGEPQLADVGDGRNFIAFDVTEITPSAVAPLAEIRDDAVGAWRAERGAAAAQAAADRILARMARGTPLAQAVSAETASVPAPERIDALREDLARQGRVPPQLALFFSMAARTAKKLEAPGQAGWFVVQLENIEPGRVTRGDPLLTATLEQLSTVTGDEYIEQFVRAVEQDVGIERNPEAVEALEAQLTGRAAS
ncbi:MAG: hypothetical protein B7Z08_03245 [Sphingomonadales bacterium 32-68-7]|nr:MAG: hypothetical protein B7Z33_05070 [Sphingomonadales bacterium 12-68-11]OYX09859.1 MAG: hypothetical protein B7Z08_03245 [Sphingomonadales bacterium 32-68-7]